MHGPKLRNFWPLVPRHNAKTPPLSLQSNHKSLDMELGLQTHHGHGLSADAPDTLDALLRFLRAPGSPVKGVMELRSLLLAQKEEKIVLRSLVDQMRVDMQGMK